MEKYLLVVQQQDNWVELLAGPIVGAKGDDEVVEPIASRLCRNDDQLVLKPIGFGIFKAVVLAALCGGRQHRDSVCSSWPPTQQAAQFSSQAAPTRAP